MDNTEIVRTVFGTFKNNKITTLTGEIIDCCTYNCIRKEINEVTGFFQLKQIGKIITPIICDYIIVDDIDALMKELKNSEEI